MFLREMVFWRGPILLSMFLAKCVYVCVNVYFCRHEITAALFPTKCPAASLYFLSLSLSSDHSHLPSKKQKVGKATKKRSLRF